MSKNFKGAAAGAVGQCALDMQNELLDKLRTPRACPDVTFDNVIDDDLLKSTYVSLLKSAVLIINNEIESVEGDNDE